MKYIWRKRAGAHWLRIHYEELTQRFGTALALIERPGSKGALLEISCSSRHAAQRLIHEFGGRIEGLPRDWLQHLAKRSEGKPVRIGSRLVILRSTRQRDPERKRGCCLRSIVIPAEAAFGTGEHATTAFCLRLLECITRPLPSGWTMLDAGTGSGILAIAASYFGAGRVVAIDSDPVACATAKRNARINKAHHIEFLTGDILKQRLTGKFDIITANLFSEIVIGALPIWSRLLAASGHLIVSGILRRQEMEVTLALRRHGFIASEIRRRGKWIALLCS